MEHHGKGHKANNLSTHSNLSKHTDHNGDALSVSSIRSNSKSSGVPRFMESEEECNLCELKDTEIAYLKQDGQQRTALVEKLESKVEGVTNEKYAVEDRLHALNAEYDDLKMQFDKMQQEMDSDRAQRETQTARLQSRIEEQRTEHMAASKELKQIKAAQTEREQQIEELEVQCEEQQNTIKQLRAKHQHLRKEMAKIQMERETLIREKEATPSLSVDEDEEEDEGKNSGDGVEEHEERQPVVSPISETLSELKESSTSQAVTPKEADDTKHSDGDGDGDGDDEEYKLGPHSFESQESTEIELDAEMKEWETTHIPNGGHSRTRSDAFLFYPTSEASNGAYSPSISSLGRPSPRRAINVTLSFDDEAIQKLEKLREDQSTEPAAEALSPRDQLKQRLNSKRIKSKAKKYKKRSDKAEAKRKLQVESS